MLGHLVSNVPHGGHARLGRPFRSGLFRRLCAFFFKN